MFSIDYVLSAVVIFQATFQSDTIVLVYYMCKLSIECKYSKEDSILHCLRYLYLPFNWFDLLVFLICDQPIEIY